jgi:peptidoglycan/LPS O-acetylase OafA/YrhL
MNPDDARRFFPAFFVFWILLGIGATVFFYTNKDAKLKRKVHPILSIAGGVIFLGSVYIMSDGRDISPIPVIAVVIIMALNIKMTRFCDTCGATLISRVPFSSPRFCQNCGAKLTH